MKTEVSQEPFIWLLKSACWFNILKYPKTEIQCTKPCASHTLPPNSQRRSTGTLIWPQVYARPWLQQLIQREESVLRLDQVLSLVHQAAVQVPWPLVSSTASSCTRASYTIT